MWKVRDGLTITRGKYDKPSPLARTENEGPRGEPLGSVPVRPGKNWKTSPNLAGCGLYSFNHTAAHYQRILSKSQPGSTVVLLFALDHWDSNIPEEYQDLLPLPWHQIEAALDKGETVERAGKARERKIVLLAAPTELQLNELIRKTKLLPSSPPNK